MHIHQAIKLKIALKIAQPYLKLTGPKQDTNVQYGRWEGRKLTAWTKAWYAVLDKYVNEVPVSKRACEAMETVVVPTINESISTIYVSLCNNADKQETGPTLLAVKISPRPFGQHYPFRLRQCVDMSHYVPKTDHWVDPAKWRTASTQWLSSNLISWRIECISVKNFVSNWSDHITISEWRGCMVPLHAHNFNLALCAHCIKMTVRLIVTMFATNGQSVRPPMYNSELTSLAAGWKHLTTWLAKMLEAYKGTARDLRRVTHNPDVANGIMGVVCWPVGPASPKVIIPDPSELMHMLNESTICPVLASLLGTEMSVIPRPISPSGAAPFKRDPVCIWPHLTHIEICGPISIALQWITVLHFCSLLPEKTKIFFDRKLNVISVESFLEWIGLTTLHYLQHIIGSAVLFNL